MKRNFVRILNFFKSNIDKDPLLVFLIILTISFGFYSILFWNQNLKYNSADSDMADEINVLFNSVTGIPARFYYSSLSHRYFFSDHINLTFSIFILFFSFFPTLNTYYFLNGITLAIGSIIVYKISKLKLRSESVSFMMSLVYLLSPIIIYFLRSAILLRTYVSIPLLLSMWYFYEKRKFPHFLLFLTLAVLTKENISLIAITFGLYLILQEKDKKWGGISIAWGGIVFLFYLFAISTKIFGTSYFSTFPIHFPEKMLENPFNFGYIFNSVFSQQKIEYLKNFFYLFGFLPLLAPEILLISSPKFFENLLYKNISVWSKNNSILIPFMIIAVIYGLKRIEKITIKYLSKWFPHVISIFMLLLIFIIFHRELLSPLTTLRKRGLDWGCPIDDKNYQARWDTLLKLKDKIPEKSVVYVDRSISLPLADRINVRKISRNNYEDAEYIIVNEELIECLKNKELDQGTKEIANIDINYLKGNPEFKIIAEENGFLLLVRSET